MRRLLEERRIAPPAVYLHSGVASRVRLDRCSGSLFGASSATASGFDAWIIDKC